MMTKKETWQRLRKLDWSLPRKMPEGKWDLVGIGQTDDLNGVDLKGVNLSGAALGDARFIGTILTDANFSRAELWEAELSGANLSGANFRAADLYRAVLCEADLSNADLSNADLFFTNLSKANLSRANLRDSNIIEVNLNLANLSGADITGSTFWGASTAGWRIDGVKAEYVYFCGENEAEKEKYRRNFQKGQFEALFRSLPTVELIFEGGLTPTSLFTLSALIERINRQNPQLGVKMADIHKNEFETMVGIKISKDEYLIEVGRLIQDAIRQVAGGISPDILAPYLTKILPRNFVEALEEVQQTQKPSIVVNIMQPTFQFIKADGSTLSGTISQYRTIQSLGDVIIKNYEVHRGEVDSLFDDLKESFSEYEASMRDSLTEATDRIIEAIRKGKEIGTIQGYWDEIKEGVKTGGAAVTIAATIGRLLGFM